MQVWQMVSLKYEHATEKSGAYLAQWLNLCTFSVPGWKYLQRWGPRRCCRLRGPGLSLHFFSFFLFVKMDPFSSVGCISISIFLKVIIGSSDFCRKFKKQRCISSNYLNQILLDAIFTPQNSIPRNQQLCISQHFAFPLGGFTSRRVHLCWNLSAEIHF